MKAAQRWRFNDANNRYTFIGFVRNVFDDEGFESAVATQSPWGVRSLNVSPTASRVYEIEAQFRFGR